MSAVPVTVKKAGIPSDDPSGKAKTDPHYAVHFISVSA